MLTLSDVRLSDENSRVLGSQMTSPVLYCWVAAIVTTDGEFVCTGTLVSEDLVVTSGACIQK